MVSFRIPLALLALTPSLWSEEIAITNWNIENLGSDSRGLAGGFGHGNLGRRTTAQLHAVAELIRAHASDLLTLQEVSITAIGGGVSACDDLQVIAAALGPAWRTYLPTVPAIPVGHDNMYGAFLWNSDRVRLISAFAMDVPQVEMAGNQVFPREPLVGYFECLMGTSGTNDFVVVNLHLKSGQENDENHLIAVTHVEHALTKALEQNSITESDRIILGDFNDNPYLLKEDGNPMYSPALYEHLAFKGFINLVTPEIRYTRMNENLTSIIDHIWVNRSAFRHLAAPMLTKYVPANGDSQQYGAWRKTYSDHFPLTFRMKVETKDDDVDFAE